MIDILMATYNGETYISNQIESILNQNYSNWKLYIRDDGSKDRTNEILNEYEQKYPEKIKIVRDSKKGLGAKLNFCELLNYSTSDYCMFSDQDDIWFENKIEITLKKMKEAENKYGDKAPILVHTDLKVVDKNLNLINDSFWKYQNLKPNYKELNYLIVQNNITGCTMMMNRKLAKISKNIPENSIMHDWWIGLVASGLGHIEYINEQTILYRQHGNNEVGAHNYNSKEYIINKLLSKNKIKSSINEAILQAEIFLKNYNDILTKNNKELLYLFTNINKKNILKRKLLIIKNKIYKQGIKRIIGYLIFI